MNPQKASPTPAPPSPEPGHGWRPTTYLRLKDLVVAWPVEHGLGAVALDVQPGSVTLGSQLIPARLDSDGQPAIAVLSGLADCAIGVSVFSSFSKPSGGSTVEMRIDRAARLGPGARSLRVEGRAEHIGEDNGLGRAVFTDDTGAVVAFGMATMAIVGRPPGARETGPAGIVPDIIPPAAVLFDPAALERLPAWDGDDPAEVTIPVDQSMANPHEQLHGGVMLAIAERAQRRLHPPGARVLSVTIEYIRPVPMGTPFVVCRSAVLRQGRRFSTVRSELYRPDGKLATIGSGITSTAS